MKVLTFENGPIRVNTYLVESSTVLYVVDPGHDIEALKNSITDSEKELGAILLTHGHIDHVAGVWELQKLHPEVPVYIHEADYQMAMSLDFQARTLGLPAVEQFGSVRVIKDERKIEGLDEVEVIHISGHSAGSVCFLIGDVLITGDTLFNFAIGRTDLMGSTTARELKQNIQQKLFAKLDESVAVYPGHGPSTTIGFEKKNNVMVY